MEQLRVYHRAPTDEELRLLSLPLGKASLCHCKQCTIPSSDVWLLPNVPHALIADLSNLLLTFPLFSTYDTGCAANPTYSVLSGQGTAYTFLNDETHAKCKTVMQTLGQKYGCRYALCSMISGIFRNAQCRGWPELLIVAENQAQARVYATHLPSSESLPCQNTTPIKKFMRCGRCRKTLYCSAECQRKQWPIHKAICKPDVSN